MNLKNDITFKLKLDNGVETEEYRMSDIIKLVEDEIRESLNEKYGCDGSCKNESVNHCECGPVFEDNKIVEIIII